MWMRFKQLKIGILINQSRGNRDMFGKQYILFDSRVFFALSITFLLPFSGCLSISEELENSKTETLLQPIQGTMIHSSNLTNQVEFVGDSYFKQIVTDSTDRMNLNYSIPQMGGNWTLYFVCSDGVEIDYTPIKPESFYCPSTQEVMEGEQYDSSWVAYRHREIIRDYGISSAMAYLFTGNNTHAENAEIMLMQYADLYPKLSITDKKNLTGESGGKLTRQSLDEAVTLIDLAWIHHVIRHTMEDDNRLSIENQLLIPGIEVINNTVNMNRDPKSNWITYHNAATAMVAVAIGDRDMMEHSINGSSGLSFQMSNGFDSDAMWHEGSIAYHNYTLTAMALHLDAAAYMGFNLYDSWWDYGSHLMHTSFPFKAHLKIVKPNGEIPRLNDDMRGIDLGDIRDLLEFSNRHWESDIIGHHLLISRQMNPQVSVRSALWYSPISSSDWSPESIIMNDFGVTVLREGELFALIDHGPHGGWHGHRDKLHLELNFEGQDITSDPGTVSYSLPESRDWYRSSYAHTTITLDNREQPETEGRIVQANFEDDISMVHVMYTDTLTRSEVHRCIVLFRGENNGFALIDIFRINGNNFTNMTRTYHFPSLIQDDLDNSGDMLLPYPAGDYVHMQQENLSSNGVLNFNIALANNSSFTTYLAEDDQVFSSSSPNSGKMFVVHSNAHENSSASVFVFGENSSNLNLLDEGTSTKVQFGLQSVVIDWDFD